MKKNFLIIISSLALMNSVIFTGCSHNADTTENSTPIEKKTSQPTQNTPTPIEIKNETFKGQVYYLDEQTNRTIGNNRAAANIDTTRDRIEFGHGENDCKIYIAQKEFSGTYTVNLETKEIAIEDAKTTDGAKMEGTLSFSDDAKAVELEATETTASGETKKIETTGIVKWNWSELGEWINETVHINNFYNNLGGHAANESLPIQLWRGEIDFTYSSYTKGIQIPASSFADLKSGDCVAFYYLNNGNKLNLFLEGISVEEKNWNEKNYNYDYFIYTLSQESLDYIKQNNGLNLYGDGNVLEGILMGSETALKAAANEFFSKKYEIHAAGEQYHIEFAIYDDSVHNNRTINFYLVKGLPPTEDNQYIPAKDENGLSFFSPDKSIYREYLGRTKINNTDSHISLKMDEYDFEIVYSDDYDIYYSLGENKAYKLKKSISDTHNMTFLLEKNLENDTYTLNFIKVPSDIKDWINTFVEIENDGFTLKFTPMEKWTEEDLEITFTDLETTGSWKTEDVANPMTSETERISVWEGDLDFIGSGFSKGFRIPKEKLEAVKEGDSIFLIFPNTKKALSTGCNGKYNYELFKNVSWNSWLEGSTESYNAIRCELKNEGAEFVKSNGLEVFADNNRLVKIAIGSRTACNQYFENLNYPQ